MPHRSFFAPPQATCAEPTALDLIIDQPAAVAEHFDFAMGLQAALTVSLLEAGLEVVPALETDPDPLGIPQLLYAEQPRSAQEVWAELAERRLAPEFLFQFQVFVSGVGVGFEGRLTHQVNGPIAEPDSHTMPPVRIVVSPGKYKLQELIERVVSKVLKGLGAEDTRAPNILKLMGVEDRDCLGIIIATLGSSVRCELGEGGVPVHREIARANKGYSARDEAIDAARRLLN